MKRNYTFIQVKIVPTKIERNLSIFYHAWCHERRCTSSIMEIAILVISKGIDFKVGVLAGRM